MSNYFLTRPEDVSRYREATDRGTSSAGVRMKRVCSKCRAKVDQMGARKVPGTGTSRHNISQWICPECQP